MHLINIIVSILLLSGLGSQIESELDHFIMHGDHFYAVAEGRYEIVKLNKNGEIIDRTGRRGRGPGEFSTDQLRMTFVGDTLYIYDSINRRLTLLDEEFNILDERFPDELLHNLTGYENELYGMVLNVPKRESDDRNVIEAQKRLDLSSFEIRAMESEQKVLSTYKLDMMTTPVYSTKKVKSNELTFTLYHPYQNTIRYYHDDSLKVSSLPSLEPITLGRELDLKTPNMKHLYKDHPYFPTYELIQNVLLSNNQSIIIQTQSYKEGEKLIFYDLQSEKVTDKVPSPPGKLIGQDDSYFYFYDEKSIKRYPLEELQSCGSEQITFYISGFQEQCYSCRESFFEIYNFVRDDNIPYQFIVKDNSWFSSPDEDDYREVVDHMRQWNTWGAVSIEDGCDGCFEGGINIQINEEEKLISLPASVSEIESKVSCE